MVCSSSKRSWRFHPTSGGKSPPRGYAYIDGHVSPLSKARVPLADRGYLLGDGAFETFRTHQGKILFLRPHLERLERSLHILGLPTHATKEAARALQALVDRSLSTLGSELYLRVQVTAGNWSSFARNGSPPRVTALVRRFEPYPASGYRNGVRLAISAQRKDARNPLSQVKSLSYLPHLFARSEARQQGADDVLFLNQEGRVCEASTSNVFALSGRTLYVPGTAEGALDGVTRRIVLQLAQRSGFRIRERLALNVLFKAEEVFLTNTIAGLLPVVRVQGRRTRFAGSQGTVWRLLSKAYGKRVEDASLARPPTAR